MYLPSSWVTPICNCEQRFRRKTTLLISLLCPILTCRQEVCRQQSKIHGKYIEFVLCTACRQYFSYISFMPCVIQLKLLLNVIYTNEKCPMATIRNNSQHKEQGDFFPLVWLSTYSISYYF